MPTLYYIRHGETDWNVEGRLQGRHDVALNARGRAQAAHCGAVLREVFARDGRVASELDYVASPLGRARQTMEAMRVALGLDPTAYRTDERLAEIAFGAWEGFTIAELRSRDPRRLALREHDKYRFVPPGGESYEMVGRRMADWYKSLSGDTVAVAHGGTMRGLIGYLGIEPAAASPLADVLQGVVYVFSADRRLARYE